VNYGYGSESGYNTNSYDEPDGKKQKFNYQINNYQGTDSEMDFGGQPEDYEPLGHQLKREMGQLAEDDILSPEFLKKFISYARRTCFPKLSREACDVLKSFYISLRENSSGHNSIPITSRQLDSIIRLSQARAKLELRSIVTQEDAQDVVKLVQESLFEACFQEVGFKASLDKIAGKKNVDKGIVDINNIGSLSGPKQTKIFIEKLKEKAEDKGDKIFSFHDLVNISRSLNMQVGDFRHYIDKLNAQMYLLMKSSKIYELNV
jgi:DNA helicase MCM8